MKLDYCSPSEEQKYKKQLGDCPEAPASFPASWEDRDELKMKMSCRPHRCFPRDTDCPLAGLCPDVVSA